VNWIVASNELFAVWCVLMVALANPSRLGVALFSVATLSSGGTGLAQLLLARQRG
jgi:hypothetical protein